MVFLSVLLNAHDLSIKIRIVSLPGLRGPVGLVGHSARFTLMCSAGGPGFDPQIGHLFFGFTTIHKFHLIFVLYQRLPSCRVSY